MTDQRNRKLDPMWTLPPVEVYNQRLERIKGNLIVAFLAIAGAFVAHSIGFSGWISGAFLAVAFITLIISIDFYAAATTKGMSK